MRNIAAGAIHRLSTVRLIHSPTELVRTAERSAQGNVSRSNIMISDEGPAGFLARPF